MTQSDGTLPERLVQGPLMKAPDFLRQLIERTLQTFLEAEMTTYLAAKPYERMSGRRGYRNGYKPRHLHTRVGTLELLVPQDRAGTFSTDLFARYLRSEQALVVTLMEMYLQGVATLKVARVTEQLCGTRFSKSQVSALTGQLDEQLTAWRNRPLTAASYPYLTVDARYEKVRIGGRVVSQGVLLVSGVRQDGYRELVGVEVADTESEATYEQLFRQLKDRGLSSVQLVTSDDRNGLRRAIARHFQGSSWQRSQVHFSHNLQTRVARHRRGEVAEDLRTILAAATLQQAQAIANTVADRWRLTYPRLAEQLDEELEA